MNLKIITILLICLASITHAQNSLIAVDEQNKDIGTQENIYKVKADYIITNNQTKKLYLLRADALKGMTIKASKKTINPNDTCLIAIEFIPCQTGKFTENINLITSADGMPYKLSLSGNIKSIKTDDKTACFYFKKPNTAGVKVVEPIVVTTSTVTRDNSNKIPDASNPSDSKPNLPTQANKNDEPKEPEVVNFTKVTNDIKLSTTLYKPNNIVFLVDVSSSMKDTMKLKVMQEALYYLIDELRPIDKITFITYADSVKLLRDGVSGSNKKDLQDVVKKLKARGLTKGNKAILYSLDVALKNYITTGNNQIIMATDGKFRFYSEDQQKFIANQGTQLVKLTTIGFGNDKDAMKNLKEISQIGKGNFIHIKNRSKAKEQLLEEIQSNSIIR